MNNTFKCEFLKPTIGIVIFFMLFNSCSLQSNNILNNITPTDDQAAPCIFEQHNYSTKDIEWLAENALSLNKSLELEDLWYELDEKVSSTNLVGIGESVHGSHELLSVRIGITKYLVKFLGFKIISLEIPMPYALKLDEYVQGNMDDLNVLLSNIGAWTINSEEISDFLRWAKEYNKFVDKKNKIHFTGYDIPINDPQSEIYIVLGYVRTNDPGSETDVKNKLGCINLTSEAYKYKTNEYKVECRAKIDGIIASFDNKKVEYLKSSSLEQYKFAEKSLKSLSQLELFYSELPEKAYALRDEFMYKNIIWIREALDKKIVIWGHNTHIGKNNFYPSNSGTLGYFLQKELGKDYYALGSTFFAGSFNAIPLDVSHIADAPPENSYETFFNTANRPTFFLSLTVNLIPPWFNSSHCLRNIGAYYDDKKPEVGWDIDILKNEFDGFIYIRNSTPTRLLR